MLDGRPGLMTTDPDDQQPTLQVDIPWTPTTLVQDWQCDTKA
jgi:hypothetical protein